MPAGEIAARFRHSWPTTTRHLKVLEDAGMIRAKPQGRLRYYSVEHRKLEVLRQWLAWFEVAGN